jgi:succinate--hydroxymethylglutarate CoA-transferase
LLARDMIQTVDHPTAGPISLLGIPIKMSDTPGCVATPPPRLGEHTASVLSGVLGIADADISTLSRNGVVELAPPPSRTTERS